MVESRTIVRLNNEPQTNAIIIIINYRVRQSESKLNKTKQI